MGDKVVLCKKITFNGKIFFSQQSSVCRAGLHAGVIDNDGGWMDVTRQGRKDFFIKSYKNGIQSLGLKHLIITK